MPLDGSLNRALKASPDFKTEIAPGLLDGRHVPRRARTSAPLGLLLLTSFRAAQMSVGAVQAVYWAVTALMGVSLSDRKSVV